MPNVVYISKIQIPINNEPVVFEFYDSGVQQKLAGGISFNVCWDGGGIPTVEDVPYGVVINYNDTEYVGTLSANSADPLTFYLVKSSAQVNNKDVYEEYIAYGSGNSKYWEKIGDTQFDFSGLKDFAFANSISLQKSHHDPLGLDGYNKGAMRHRNTMTNLNLKSPLKLKTGSHHSLARVPPAYVGYDPVSSDSDVTITGTIKNSALGVNAEFESSDSNITWEKKGGNGADKNDPNHVYKNALGANASFTTTITTTNKYLKAVASNMDINSDGNEVSVLTGIESSTSDSFYDKADAIKAKLATISVYDTDGTESISSVSNIDTKYLTLTSVPIVTTAGSADTWAFNYNSETSTLEIGCISDGNFVSGSGNGTGLQLSALDATVATGAVQNSGSGAGTSVVTGMTINSVVAAKRASSPTTIATGSLLHDSTDEINHSDYINAVGSEIVYDLDTNTSNAMVGLGTQNHSYALTDVVIFDPIVTCSLENSNATGRVSVATAIAANNISTTVNNQDEVNTIIGLANATADAQTIHIEDADTANVVVDRGTCTANAQTVQWPDHRYREALTSIGNMQTAGQTAKISNPAGNNIDVAEYDSLGISVS